MLHSVVPEIEPLVLPVVSINVGTFVLLALFGLEWRDVDLTEFLLQVIIKFDILGIMQRLKCGFGVLANEQMRLGLTESDRNEFGMNGLQGLRRLVRNP